MDRKSGHPNQPNQPTDPYLYAATLNSFMVERNPIQVLVGDVARMIKVVANLGKTRKLAQQRIDQLQSQVEKVERNIEHVNPKTLGTRLDKLR